MDRLIHVACSFQRGFVRGYAFKSDLKIKWIRPAKIPCIKPEKSGDNSKLPTIDADEFLPQFKFSRELQSADPMVQSIFQLENNRNRFTSKFYRDLMIKGVHRHSLDYGSMEAKLARLTTIIRQLQEHMERFPRDRNIKVALKEIIDRRKKYLKYLRRWDYRRFEWLLDKLDLVYKPPPAEFHWITRKESLRKLTNLSCDKIKSERLSDFREQLEERQVYFLQDALHKLESIRKQQLDHGLPTEEKIREIRKLIELKKNSG